MALSPLGEILKKYKIPSFPFPLKISLAEEVFESKASKLDLVLHKITVENSTGNDFPINIMAIQYVNIEDNNVKTVKSIGIKSSHGKKKYEQQVLTDHHLTSVSKINIMII